MERITLRKRIDPKIILYIVVGLVSFPVVAYRVFEYADHRRLLGEASESIAQGRFDEAKGTIQTNFEKHGYKRKVLEQWLELLEATSPESSSFEVRVRRIRVAQYLLSHFRIASKSTHRKLGQSYFELGSDYYGLSKKHLNRYIQRNDAKGIDPEVYQNLYAIYSHEGAFERAERVARRMHESQPDNLAFKTQLALHYLAHGKVLSARNLLEEIVYNEPYSEAMARAANLLASLLEERLGLEEEGNFVKKYLRYKTHPGLGQAFLSLPPLSEWPEKALLNMPILFDKDEEAH